MVVDDLPNTRHPSTTQLTMLLLRNPGRANGGLFARAHPVAAIFGIDTVTPEVAEETHETEDGTARLIPTKIDATVEYDPLSDFPSWPNPVALANSGAALFFPTYILRSDDTFAPFVAEVLLATAEAAGPTTGPEASRNQFITMDAEHLPLLEPARLPFDFFNIMSGGTFSNPFADAVEPALTILVNLGYTDVNQEEGYTRDFDEFDEPTAFFTLPENVDWGQVPGDVFEAFMQGVQDEFFSGGIPGFHPPGEDVPPNAILALAELLGLPTTPAGMGDLTDLVTNLPGLGDVIADLFGGLPSAGSPSNTDQEQLALLSQPATSETVTEQTPSPPSDGTPQVQEVADTSAASGGVSAPAEEPAPAELPRPRFNVVTETGNRAIPTTIGPTVVSDMISSGRAQFDNAGCNVPTMVKTVTDGVRSALTAAIPGSRTGDGGSDGSGD
jgi:hypothetical protein